MFRPAAINSYDLYIDTVAIEALGIFADFLKIGSAFRSLKNIVLWFDSSHSLAMI